MTFYGVIIIAAVTAFSSSNNVTDGNIRLLNSKTNYEGRIEVYYKSSWISVSQDGWSKQDAIVSCHKLGFTSIVPIATRGKYYGEGSSDYGLSQIACTGNELSLLDCPFEIDTRYRHYKDAGLRCVPQINNGSCLTGAVRLINETATLTGRVEVCIGGVWGTIVQTGFDHKDAQVVCRQLGYYNKFAQIALRGYSDGTGPIMLSRVSCNGNESSILECDYNGPSFADAHYKDVGAKCFRTPSSHSCKFGDIRLANGVTFNEGRVELCIAGVWGTITDDGFDNKDAAVICNQLGFSANNSIAFKNAHFGEGTGPIYLKNLKCQGTESSILQCGYYTFVYYDSHAEDAGVKCELLEPSTIKSTMKIKHSQTTSFGNYTTSSVVASMTSNVMDLTTSDVNVVSTIKSTMKIKHSQTTSFGNYTTSSIVVASMTSNVMDLTTSDVNVVSTTKLNDNFSFSANDTKVTKIIAGCMTILVVICIILVSIIVGVLAYKRIKKQKVKRSSYNIHSDHEFNNLITSLSSEL